MTPDLELHDRDSVGILLAGRLGDTILTTPLLRGLRRLIADRPLIALAAEDLRPLLEPLPWVDRIVTAPRGAARMVPRLALAARRERVGLLIDIKDHPSTTSRYLARLAGARWNLMHPANAPAPGSLPLPPASPPHHYVDQALAPLALLAPGETFERRPRIVIPDEAWQAVDRQIDPGDRGMVAVNISAGSETRLWPLERWRRLVKHIAERHHVAILSAPADRSRADAVAPTTRRVRTIRTDSILEAAAALGRSLALVSPDTSLVHLSSALDLPGIFLFPPDERNLEQFAPLARRHVLLRPEPGHPLADIEVESVIDALDLLLATPRP